MTPSNQGNVGFGKYMIVHHGVDLNAYRYYTIYGHLDSFSVPQGTEVGGRELIALSGNSGASEAAHLHFEIKVVPPGGPGPFADGFYYEAGRDFERDPTDFLWPLELLQQ